MYATVQDVADELGQDPPIGVEERQWNRWLSRVHAIIRTRIPDLDMRVEDGLLSRADVADVQAAVVARKVMNPQGLSESTIRIDDGTVTQRGGNDYAGLTLTDEEWALLLPEEIPLFTVVRAARESW